MKIGSVLDMALRSASEEDYNAFLDGLHKAASYVASNVPGISRTTVNVLGKVVECEPTGTKLASWVGTTSPTVVQVSKRSDGYLLKMASHLSWDPSTSVIDRGAVVRAFGERLAMDVDVNGGATLQESEEEPPTGEEAETNVVPTDTFGLYKITDATGKEHVGFVIPSLIDLNGDDVPIKLFTNGSVVAVQADMVGEPSGAGGNLPSAPVSGEGVFWGSKDDGGVIATVPFKFESSAAVGGQPKTFQGQTFDGMPASVSVQPNIVKPVSNGD